MRLAPIHSDMVGLPGFEPGTSRLSGARSDQLSYRPATSPVRLKFNSRAGPHPGIQPESKSIESGTIRIPAVALFFRTGYGRPETGHRP